MKRPGTALARWTPVGITAVLLLVAALGLRWVPQAAVKAASWMHAAEPPPAAAPRNLALLGQDEKDVRQAVWRLVYGEEPGPDPAAGLSWTEAVQAHGWVQGAPSQIVVLPAEGPEALAWALPGAYWAVYAGCPFVFTGRDRLDDEAADLIRQYRLPVYVAAPAKLISETVLRRLSALAPARRIAGETLAAQAAAVAEFRVAKSRVRWTRAYRRGEDAECVLAAPSGQRQALAALPLAHFKGALLLYTGEDGELPPESERFLQRRQRTGWLAPAGLSIRRFWLAGAACKPQVLARLDALPAVRPSSPISSPPPGPAEAVLLALIAAGGLCGAWVCGHGWAVRPRAKQGLRLAWALTSVLAPAAGLWLYHATRRRAGAVCSPAARNAAATAVAFGYGAPVLLAAAYGFIRLDLSRYFGPRADGWEFLLGTGAMLLVAAAAAGLVLLVWAKIQMPLQIEMAPGAPWPDLAVRSLTVTLISLAALGAGMLATAWGLQMSQLAQASAHKGLLRLGSMWLASLVGFLLAWPSNYPLMRFRSEAGKVKKMPDRILNRLEPLREEAWQRVGQFKHEFQKRVNQAKEEAVRQADAARKTAAASSPR